MTAPWPIDPEDMVRVIRALTALVMAEYPDKYSISDVVSEWGPDVGLSADDIAAVLRVAPMIRD